MTLLRISMLVSLGGAALLGTAARVQPDAPPNETATNSLAGDLIRLTCQGVDIFEGHVRNPGAVRRAQSLEYPCRW
jgi:hypothetical protein